MERYESKQVQIRRPASIIYGAVSDFTNFTPIVADKVEEWSATEDTCSFRAKGFKVGLRIVEKEQDKVVKITGDGSLPMDFTFWIQLHEVEANDTRMRLVLDAELNMMMKMMVGGKLKDALDQIAERIAEAMNTAI